MNGSPSSWWCIEDAAEGGRLAPSSSESSSGSGAGAPMPRARRRRVVAGIFFFLLHGQRASEQCIASVRIAIAQYSNSCLQSVSAEGPHFS